MQPQDQIKAPIENISSTIDYVKEICSYFVFGVYLWCMN